MQRRAVEAPGPSHPDARAWLHGGLLAAGRVDEAHALAEQVRRSAPTDGDVYEFIGETYEAAGDLGRAHRWFTLGATRLQRLVEDGADDSPTVSWLTMLLRGRWRVRRAMGMPLDEDDELIGPPPAER